MTIEQAYYTSCRHGVGAGPGFQFNAVSPGLERAVLDELEGLVGYEPPLAAPAQPTAGELAAFPVAFSYTRLRAGGAAVGQTRYVGADYSGRYGNFFAHVLYLRDVGRDLGTAYPIDLWRSPVWADAESPSLALPPLPGVAPGTAELGEIAAFFASAERQSRLPLFLAAVRLNLTAERRRPIILVERDQDAAGYWIALASYCLPPELARGLTFTTYSRSPYYADQTIVGTTPDAHFAYSPHELSDRYVVLDFVGDRFSPPIDDEWAALAARLWRPGSAALLAEFAARLRAGALPGAADEQGGMLATFVLARERTLSARSLALALDWIRAHPALPDDAYWAAVAQGVARHLGAMPLALLGAYAHEWRIHRPPAEAEPIADAYFRALIGHVADGGSPDGLAPVVPEQPDDRWLAALLEDPATSLMACHEILRLLAAARLRLAPGWLQGFGASRVASAVLTEPEAHPSVAALLAGPGGEDVGRGLAGRLEAELRRGADGFAAVVSVAGGPLAAWLERQSAGELDLVLRLQRAEPHGRAALLAALADHGDEVLAWGHERLCGAGPPLSAREAADLLDRMGADRLRTAALLRPVMDVALDAPALADDVIALAERLHADGAARDAADDALLRAVADCRMLRHRRLDPTPAVIARAADTAAAAAAHDRAVGAAVLAQVARWAAGLAPDDQAAALAALFRTRRKPIMLAYKRAALAAAIEDPRGWVTTVADLFTAWVRLDAEDPKNAAGLRHVVFPMVLESAPRRALGALEQELAGRDDAVRSAWEAARRPARRRRG